MTKAKARKMLLAALAKCKKVFLDGKMDFESMAAMEMNINMCVEQLR